MFIWQLRWYIDELAKSGNTKEATRLQKSYAEQLEPAGRSSPDDWAQVVLRWGDHVKGELEAAITQRRPQRPTEGPKFLALRTPVSARPESGPGPVSRPGKKNGKQYVKTNNPIPTSQLPAGPIGESYDLAAYRSFQLSSEGRDIPLETLSFIASAYRLTREGHTDLIAQEDKTGARKLSLVNEVEATEIRNWMKSSPETRRFPGSIRSLQYINLENILDTNQELTDQEVDAFMELIQAYSPDGAKIFAVKSGISERFPHAKGRGESFVKGDLLKRLTVQATRDSVSSVVLPMAFADHWVLFAARPQDKQLWVIDSIGNTHNRHANFFAEYMRLWTNGEFEQWRIVNQQSVIQPDNSACGAMCCYNAARLFNIAQGLEDDNWQQPSRTLHPDEVLQIRMWMLLALKAESQNGNVAAILNRVPSV